MDKTILIRTNASDLPDIVEQAGATIIDGSLKNLFCTYLGYELVDGLCDNNNIPYYRLLRPSQILLDFEKVKPEAFNELFREWQGILENLFINGIHNNNQSSLEFKFHIQQGLTDWLLGCDDSSYYNIGVKICQMPNISITIDNEQYNEITNYFVQRIKQEIDNEDNKLSVIFCNHDINSSSSIVDILEERLPLIQIVPFHIWVGKQMEKEMKKKMEEEILRREKEHRQKLEEERERQIQEMMSYTQEFQAEWDPWTDDFGMF